MLLSELPDQVAKALLEAAHEGLDEHDGLDGVVEVEDYAENEKWIVANVVVHVGLEKRQLVA